MSGMGLLSVAAGFFNADATAKEGKAQVDALENEALQYEKNAFYIREAGKFNANRQQIEATQIFGAMRAGTAASGIEQDSGSALEVMRQSYTNAELDKLTILHEAEIKAINASNRASALQSQASGVRRATDMKILSSLLGGGMNAGMMGGGGGSGGGQMASDGGGEAYSGGGGAYPRIRSGF
jgi:hypothetical protein